MQNKKQAEKKSDRDRLVEIIKSVTNNYCESIHMGLKITKGSWDEYDLADALISAGVVFFNHERYECDTCRHNYPKCNKGDCVGNDRWEPIKPDQNEHLRKKFKTSKLNIKQKKPVRYGSKGENNV